MKQLVLLIAFVLHCIPLPAQFYSCTQINTSDPEYFSFPSSINILACPAITPPATPVLPLLNQFTLPTMATNMSSTGVSIAVKPNGTVWGSGSDQGGEMGDGTVGSPFMTGNVWVQVPGPDIFNIKQVSLGFNTCFALRGDGTLWGWGENWWGKIGDGNQWVAAQPVPQQVKTAVATPLTNVVKVSAGYAMTFALTSNHHVYGWGNNYGGTMGPSFIPNNFYSFAGEITDNGITPINWAIDIGVGDEFIAILRWDSTLWTMGSGWCGQLGNGNIYGPGGGSSIPSCVVSSAACNPLTKIISIAVGRRFMLALDVTGAVYGWGLNNYGQTGTGAGSDVFIPKRVLGNNCSGFLSEITSIAASGDNGYAVDSNGNLWSWGADFDGQLGDGSPPDGNFDCPKIATTGVVEVQAGLNSVLILKNDGCIYGAGNNWFGSLGGPLPASCCGVVSAFNLTNLSISCQVPLPMELISFTGVSANDINYLHWTTGAEINNHYFLIERSRDAILFEIIGKIAGNGNSTLAIQYNFIDQNPHQGINYYRLKQVDYDGEINYSPVISVENKFKNTQCFIHSTDENGIFILTCNSIKKGTLIIYDSQGNLLKKMQVEKFNSGIPVDLNELRGKYFIAYIFNEHEYKAIKIIKN